MFRFIWLFVDLLLSDILESKDSNFPKLNPVAWKTKHLSHWQTFLAFCSLQTGSWLNEGTEEEEQVEPICKSENYTHVCVQILDAKDWLVDLHCKIIHDVILVISSSSDKNQNGGNIFSGVGYLLSLSALGIQTSVLPHKVSTFTGVDCRSGSMISSIQIVLRKESSFSLIATSDSSWWSATFS